MLVDLREDAGIWLRFETNLRTAPAKYSHGADNHNQSHEQEDAGPLQWLIAFWRKASDERSEDRSADQSADMAGVVDARKHTAQQHIDHYEESETLQRSFDHGAGQ